MALERSVNKFTMLPVGQYDGYARLGELIVDITVPGMPALYIGNVTGNVIPAGGGGGGGSPGGMPGQIQFNSGGTFGGSPALTFDGANMTVGGNVTATNFIGNLVGNVSGNIGSATSNVTANVITANTGNIGTINSNVITANGNVTGGNLVTGGNVYANSGNVFANGVYSNVVTANGNVTGGNLVTGGNVYANSGNVFANGVYSNVVTANGNVTGGNIVTAGNVYANSGNVFANGVYSNVVTANGNVTGGNIVTAGNVYANSGNVFANGVYANTGNIGNLNVTGNANLGPVGNIYIGGGTAGQVLTTNGSGGLSWTTVGGGGGTYGDSNVVTLLGTFGSNNISTTGNITAGNFIGVTSNVSGNSNVGGNLNVVGNISGGNISATTSSVTGNANVGGNLNVTGNAAVTGDLTVTGNISGNFAAPGSNTQVIFNKAGLLGAEANLTFDNATGTLAAPRATVGNTALGASALTLYGGTSGQFLRTNGTGTLSWASPSVTVPGSDTQVLFNDGGSLGADAGMTYNKTTDTLSSINLSVSGTANFYTTSSNAVTNPAMIVQNGEELVRTVGTGAAGTINFDCQNAVQMITADATSNWTTNFRYNANTALANVLIYDAANSISGSMTVVHMVKIGAATRYASAFQVDGVSVTPIWQGGTAPVAGNANGYDVYSYTIVRTGTSTYTVLASQTQFK